MKFLLGFACLSVGLCDVSVADLRKILVNATCDETISGLWTDKAHHKALNLAQHEAVRAARKNIYSIINGGETALWQEMQAVRFRDKLRDCDRAQLLCDVMKNSKF